MSRFMNLITSGVKYSMFFFNVLFVITGIIILSIGAVIQAEYYKYHPFLTDQFFTLPSFLIVTGIFIFIIAFFGCCGAVKENYCMILTFAILMVLIFIFELAAGISGYVLKGRAEALLTKTMLDSMSAYSNETTAVTILWDELQKEFDCCGVKGADDWQSLSNTHGLIPVSCCDLTGVVDTISCNKTSPTLHQEGCLDHMADWTRSHAGTLGAVGLALAIIQVLAIVFACHLARKTKYETMA